MTMGARFGAGQQIEHCKFRYRGVIYAVDPVFLGSDQWYEQMAISSPPKNAPWYHVLVHEADHTTYVAERNLDLFTGIEQIDHPLLGEYFSGFDNGRYLLRE
ncbi:MAG: heat shock protein HspQ [Pseudomonadales bacterium]|nr:heat shock protein HspQ [Pseudomonadales bacterium]